MCWKPSGRECARPEPRISDGWRRRCKTRLRLRYLRRLITGGEIKERPKEEIKLLRTEIHQIGNNINQFARMANACGADVRDVRRIQQSMNQVYALIYRIGSK